MEKLRLQLGDDELSQGLDESLHRDILSDIATESWWPEDRELLLEVQPGEIEWRPDTFEVIECAGCGRVSFAHRYVDLGWSEDEHDAVFVERADYYPFPVSRRRPPWIAESRLFGPVPFELRGLFNEIYEAVCGGQHRLAAMGVRALLERLLIDKVGDHGSFARNLDAICEKGFISPLQRDTLNAVLDAGHAAKHRLYDPTESELSMALDIAEGVFASIYVHVDAARELSDRVPPRQEQEKSFHGRCMNVPKHLLLTKRETKAETERVSNLKLGCKGLSG